jgi:hypothetical protein
LLAPLLLLYPKQTTSRSSDRKKEEKAVKAVDVEELRRSLTALWDVLMQAEDEIATIVNTLGWPKSEEEGRQRAWLYKAGSSPIEITLADYYAAAKGVENND